MSTELRLPKLLLLGMFCVVFIALHLILFTHYRLAADDHHFVFLVNNYGVWGSMEHIYQHWTGRWAPLLLLGFAIKSYSLFGSTVPYHAASLAAISLSIFLLVRTVLKVRFSFQLGALWLTGYAFLFTAMLFFATIDIGETWFWITSSSHYLWGITAVCAGTAVVLARSVHWPAWLLLLLCSLFTGCANETIAFPVIASILALLLRSFVKAGLRLRIALKNNFFLKLLIAFIIAVTSFLLLYSAPGNDLRAGRFPDNIMANAAFITLRSAWMLFSEKLPDKLPYLLAFAVPWFVLGNASQANMNHARQPLKQAGIALFCLFTLIILSLIPAAWVMSDIPPDRALVSITLFFTLFATFCSFWLGGQVKLSPVFRSVLFYVSILSVTAVTAFHLHAQYPIADKYAKAVDQRMAFLDRLKAAGQTRAVALAPLPPSGMLPSAEITTDSLNHKNMHLKMSLNLDFSIVWAE